MLRRLVSICLAVLLGLPSLAAASATILVYGDSLSAAYGLAPDAGWVSLLQSRLKQEGYDYTVTNASISGETTAGGATRIAAALADHKPAVVILELGANDGLRGLPIDAMRANLANMLRASKKAGSRVLLVGMRMPPNYGPSYARAFERAYAELAREHKTAFLPHLLQGMDQRRELFQADNLHPTAKAQTILLDNVWQALLPLLQRKRGK